MAAPLCTAREPRARGLLERSEFESAWTGELILLTKQIFAHRRWPTVSICDGFYRPCIAIDMCSAKY